MKRVEFDTDGRYYIATIDAEGITLREKRKRNGARFAPWYEILGASSNATPSEIQERADRERERAVYAKAARAAKARAHLPPVTRPRVTPSNCEHCWHWLGSTSASCCRCQAPREERDPVAPVSGHYTQRQAQYDAHVRFAAAGGVSR
jgi:hypothetical protein